VEKNFIGCETTITTVGDDTSGLALEHLQELF